MKTVHDLFVEALALKRQGLSPQKIKDKLIDIGHDHGFRRINENGSGGGGQPTSFRLQFPNGEVIYFDGSDWHHLP